MSLVVARIRQVDGSVRVLRAQDARHAKIARELLRQNSAWVDSLHGVDGIRISVSTTTPRP